MFKNIWSWINQTIGKLNIEGFIIDFYNQHIKEIPELFKLLLFVFIAIIFILGTIAFVKKTIKLFVVLLVLAIIIIWLSK